MIQLTIPRSVFYSDIYQIFLTLNLELMDKVCYLDGMQSLDGDSDAAAEARISIECNKFRDLIPLHTNMDISLIMRGKLYSSCV